MSLSPSPEPDQLMLVPASESEENNQPNSDKQIFVPVSDTGQVLFIKDTTTVKGEPQDFQLHKLDQREVSRLDSLQLVPTYKIHPSLVESVKAVLKMMESVQEQKDLAFRRYIRGEDPRLGLSGPVEPTFKVHPSLVESMKDGLTENDEKILKSFTRQATPFHSDPAMVEKMRAALTWHLHLPKASTAVPTGSSTANNKFDAVPLFFKLPEHANSAIPKKYGQFSRASTWMPTGCTVTNHLIDSGPQPFKLPFDSNIHMHENYEHNWPKTSSISIQTGSAAAKDPSSLQSSSKTLGSFEGSSKSLGSGEDWSKLLDAGTRLLLKCLLPSAAGEGSGKTLAAGQGSKKTLEKRKMDSFKQATDFLRESFEHLVLSDEGKKKKKKIDQGNSTRKQTEDPAPIPNQREDPATIPYEEAFSLFMLAEEIKKNVEGTSKRKQTAAVATPNGETLSDVPVLAESKRRKLQGRSTGKKKQEGSRTGKQTRGASPFQFQDGRLYEVPVIFDFDTPGNK